MLFLPLPADLKYRAKPFIDVTMDRFAKGVGALLILVLHQGLGLWPRLAAAELRQPGDGRPVGRHRDCRAPRVPAVVPPQHRAAGRRAGRAAPQQSRSRRRSRRWSASWRIRSRGACSMRSICSTRWTSAISSRRCCWRTTSPEIRARALRVAEVGGRRAGRSLAARRRAGAEGSATAPCASRPCRRWPRCAAKRRPT